MTWIVLATAALVAGVLASDRAQSALGAWTCKPLASAGFVLLGVCAGGLASAYGRAVLAALVLSWVGDVALISRTKRAFLAGLGAFLLAHLAFAGAFVVRGVSLGGTLAAGVVVALLASRVLAWLMPHVSPRMRVPVLAYVAAISLMVSLACGAALRSGSWAIALGALLFFASDLAVARNRFVAPGFVNRAWGLPVYYAAQIVFALTVP